MVGSDDAVDAEANTSKGENGADDEADDEELVFVFVSFDASGVVLIGLGVMGVVGVVFVVCSICCSF